MVKIKKCVQKLLTIVLALLVVLNTSAIGVLAESASTNEVTPTENDYEFSGGTIKGLKANYLEGLTTEQKQNIRLEIPGKIGDNSVTSIGEKAFSQYFKKDIRIIYLDLSQLTELKEIKQYAFYSNASMCGTIQLSKKLTTIGSQSFEGCSSLTGALTLPDSLITMGGNTFNGCKGLTGKLTLSKNMTVIPSQAFKDCNFTGNLEIPECVTKIADNAFRLADKKICFQGKIVIPTSVTVIEKYAFLNQNGLTEVEFPDCNVESIGEAAFKGTGLSGVWTVPEKIGTIAKNAFYDTNLETIYLPSKTTSINKEAFNKCSKLNAIVCEKDNYSTFYGLLDSSVKEKLGYPITVKFEDGSEGLYESKECLYNLPYNYEKDSTGVWAPNNNYKFPKVQDSDIKAWALSPSSVKVAVETEAATSNILYAIFAVTSPTITYSGGINKTYDGKPATLSVSVEHPAGSEFEKARPGNVVFKYYWYYNTIGHSDPVLTGFDKDTLDIEDVILPEENQSGGMSVTVWVYWYYVNDKWEAKYVDRESHSFSVYYNSSESTVTPTVSNDHFYIDESGGDWPRISLTAGDTPGTIKWNEGQSLQAGQKEYCWTFTPETNSVGSSNYRIKTGTITLTGKDREGSVTDVKDEVDKLPPISDGAQIEDDVKTRILDTFMHYDSLPQDVKSEIDSAAQDKIFESLEKMPNINATVDAAAGFAVDNKLDLIKNITTEDALGIKAKAVDNYEIQLVAESTDPEDDEKEAINDLGDITISDSFEVKVKKKIITSDGSENVEVLNEVEEPIKMVFDVPNDLRSAGSGVKLHLIRIHTAEGKTTADILPDEDTNPNTITVTSNKFSKYIIGYEGDLSTSTDTTGGSGGIFSYTITASAGHHGTITPSGTAYAYYGSTKTFNFTPDEGYKVADVVVDGASVGAVSSYTFENITKAHTISVTFEPIADDQDRIINGVKATTIKASSSAKKGAITVKWKKSAGFKVDYFQVFRSTKKNSGYGTKAFYTTKSGTQKNYKNTKTLKKGTRYYYKVRGVRTIDGVKVYTKWSNKAIRIAK